MEDFNGSLSDEANGGIIYNVTTKVEHSIADAWLAWLKDEHIPDLIATGCFTHAVILQLMDVDEGEGVTYAVQYYTENKVLYNRYIEQYADTMRKKVTDKWDSKVISLRTLMKIVN